jgi:hypothetical protein
MRNETKTGTCELCGRFATTLSEHHLIPRSKHKNKRVRKIFSLEEMRTRKFDFCHPCHKGVHIFFSEKELALEYNSIEMLRAEPRIAKHIEWVRSQREDFKLKGGRLSGTGRKVGNRWHSKFRGRKNSIA